jgi:hypothetical protein
MVVSLSFNKSSMMIIRSFINSQPAKIQEELCKAMVRDLMDEISREDGSALVGPVSDDNARFEGRAIRGAKEIFVEKDSSLGDDRDTRYMELLMELERFGREGAIDFRSRWGEFVEEV